MVFQNAKLFALDRDAARFLASLSDDGLRHLADPILGNPLLHHTASVIAMLRKAIAINVPCDLGEAGAEDAPFLILHDDMTQFESDLDVLRCIEADSMGELTGSDSDLSSAIEKSLRSNDAELSYRLQESSMQTTFPLIRRVYALQRELMDVTCR